MTRSEFVTKGVSKIPSSSHEVSSADLTRTYVDQDSSSWMYRNSQRHNTRSFGSHMSECTALNIDF
ncbi:uncharacterized protein CCR75_003377 [Bremia lactucae]|uniref:Uncharacterized protein n=1 Tax=Bremia lactucae TaxID=4779 RepID=A0A976IHK3_BRELC|nr:hypothetical protein CCR75_003377 [Bremia lactucae]